MLKFSWSPTASAAKKRRKLAQAPSALGTLSAEGGDIEDTGEPRVGEEATQGLGSGTAHGLTEEPPSGSQSLPSSLGDTVNGLNPGETRVSGAVLSPTPPHTGRGGDGRGGEEASSASLPASKAQGGGVEGRRGGEEVEGEARKREHSLALQEEGNQLAQRGDFEAALAKWAAALALTPSRPELHESRAQVLMEMGHTWKAVQSATRATVLAPEWPEGWLTLSRAQLNLGEATLALSSAMKARALKPDDGEALQEVHTAQVLVTRQRQMQQETSRDAARLAAGGVKASRVNVESRIRVVEGPDRTSRGGRAGGDVAPCTHHEKEAA